MLIQLQGNTKDEWIAQLKALGITVGTNTNGNGDKNYDPIRAEQTIPIGKVDNALYLKVTAGNAWVELTVNYNPDDLTALYIKEML